MKGDVAIRDHVSGFPSSLQVGAQYKIEACQIDAVNFLVERATLFPGLKNFPLQAVPQCAKWYVDDYTGRWLDPVIPAMHYDQTFFDLDAMCLSEQTLMPKISLIEQVKTAMLRWDTAAGTNPPLDPNDPNPPAEMDWTFQNPNPTAENFDFNDNGKPGTPEMGILARPLGFNGNNTPILGETRTTYRNAGTSKLYTCFMGNVGMFEITSVRMAISSDVAPHWWNNELNGQSRCAMWTILHELGHGLGLYERNSCKGKTFPNGARYDFACMWFESGPVATSWTINKVNGLLELDDKLRIARLYAREKTSSTPKPGICSQSS